MRFQSALLFCTVSLSLHATLQAQTAPIIPPDISEMTATPIMGVGHDYLKDLNETVNPADGTLSLRIAAPPTGERNKANPVYAYIYDSNTQFLPLAPSVTAQPQPCSLGTCIGNRFYIQKINGIMGDAGQFYPEYKNVNTQQTPLIITKQDGQPHTECTFTVGYTYTDPSGGRHPLNLVNAQDTDGTGSCQSATEDYVGEGWQTQTGGDEEYKVNIRWTSRP